MIDIFISHASKDKLLVEALTQLIKDTIHLDGGEIRCTSSYLTDLAIGSNFTKQIRDDIEESEVVLAILSQYSISSQFCLFELGAAWGLKIPIKPILAPGLDQSLVDRPLSDLNFLSWNSETDWVKLLKEIAKLTDGELEDMLVIYGKVRAFCKIQF